MIAMLTRPQPMAITIATGNLELKFTERVPIATTGTQLEERHKKTG